MKKELPPFLSINDAVSLIINLPYQPGTTDVLEMLSYFREQAEANLDHAKTSEDKEKYRAQVAIYLTREAMARSLMQAIGLEISAISKGKESTLEIEEGGFGSEKLVTASVYAWADEMAFHTHGWEPPRHWRKKSERTFSTDYLDILDDVIATFCEEGGEEYVPNNKLQKAAVSAWIKGKYPGTSEKVNDVIGTLLRQVPIK